MSVAADHHDFASQTLTAALNYARCGWPVFPIVEADKKPATPHGVHDATTDASVIQPWFNNGTARNVGIATGAKSGFFVLDIDPAKGGDDALDELESQYGTLPNTVESLTGGGGRHLLFQYPGRKVRNGNNKLGPGIDIRGDGGFIVAPPSVHESGKRYAWEWSSDPDNVDIAKAPDWLAELVCNVSERAERHISEVSAVSAVSETSEAIIEQTLPTGPGQRNACLLSLARGLKFNAGLRDYELHVVKPYVRAWWERALQAIRTKYFDETWMEFVHAWEHARFPLHVDLSAVAFQRARDRSDESETSAYDDPDMRLLVRACIELQLLQGKDGEGALRPFSLSHSQVARSLWGECKGREWHARRKRAGRMLNMLEVDQVLKAVRRGIPGPPGNPATRYIYIAEELEL